MRGVYINWEGRGYDAQGWMIDKQEALRHIESNGPIEIGMFDVGLLVRKPEMEPDHWIYLRYGEWEFIDDFDEEKPLPVQWEHFSSFQAFENAYPDLLIQ